MSLTEYKRKRNFRKTPEPVGKAAPSKKGKAKAISFVIQKHDASRLHYDFRLELGGTLKSWAVPKGPSLDPSVKVLAVHVEDHPLEYAGFEGIIPEGEYGGGTVMVWDRGTWEPEGDAARMYREGKLKFTLDGEKLHGSWALVRMGGRAGEDGKNWLLIKHDDDAARPLMKYDISKKEPNSVVSGRSLDEIAAAADRAWGKHGEVKAKSGARTKKPVAKKQPARATARKKAVKKKSPPSHERNGVLRHGERKRSPANVPGARRAAQPTALRPQLATLSATVPPGDRWLHELKFDGYRILAFLRNGKVRLVTRNGNDWMRKFQPVAGAMAKLPIEQGILDGEIVVLNDEGLSDFQRLQNALKRGETDSLVVYLFDLPHVDGYNLTGAALMDRKKLLKEIVLSGNPKNAGVVRFSDHVEGEGETVLQQACQQQMEGIVCKLIDGHYIAGRSTDWLKVKCLQRQEFVIGGFTKAGGSRLGFGALLLGYYDGEKLVYAGRVGTGFTHDSLLQLAKELKARQTRDSPFSGPLTSTQRSGVAWVRPELVGEVAFTEWTDEGLLRHPSFHGLREDKPPKQIIRERAKSMPRKLAASRPAASKRATSAAKARDECTVAGVRITHPDRVVYPDPAVTKCDLALYYAWIADRMLPYVAGRPLTLVRCPEGPSGQCFFQKHITGTMPEAVRGIKIREKSGTDEYLVVDDATGLVSLVQMGVLEMHPWPAREDNVERPEMFVFDLDPGEGVDAKQLVQAVRDVKDVLEELGLESFLRTSGGKGFHVVVPIARRIEWEPFKAFAHGVADALVRRDPERYIATMSKAKRQGKVFVDYLRNQRGATAIATFSTRARDGAPVATPLAWDELSTKLKPNAFTVTNIRRRLDAQKMDPWADFFKTRQTVSKAMERKLESLG